MKSPDDFDLTAGILADMLYKNVSNEIEEMVGYVSEKNKAILVSRVILNVTNYFDENQNGSWLELSEKLRLLVGKPPLDPRIDKIFYNPACSWDSEYLSKQAVKERGWTDGMIQKFLNGPDVTYPNKYGKGLVNLFLEDRVMDAESSKEFREYVASIEAKKPQQVKTKLA